MGIGTCLAMSDMIFPGFFVPVVALMVRWTGLILAWTGVMVYIGRDVMVGGSKLVDLANPNRTLCLHIGKSNAKILSAKKSEPNRLKARGVGRSGNMNIKDMGESLNLAGHDLVVTTQDDGHTVPLWLCDLVDKWKKRYGVRSEKELMKLYDKIGDIKSYSDLETIPFLQPVMNDPERRKHLFDLSIDEIKEMRERLFDGRTVNVFSYLGWAEGATPYDNESLIESEVAHHRAQDSSLRYLGGMDWAKIAPVLLMLLIGGAIAFQIFGTG